MAPKVIRRGQRATPATVREVRGSDQREPAPDSDRAGQRRIVAVGTVGSNVAPGVRVAPAKEFVEHVFEPGVNRTVAQALGDIREAVEVDGVVGTVGADHVVSSGGTIIVESDEVLGPRGRARGPAARSMGPQGARANWTGQSGAHEQNVVLDQPALDVDPEAIPANQQTLRRQAVGPASPTGLPCSCAYEWEEEVDPESGATAMVIYSTGGIPTGFKGAPPFMTWCIICGGERGENGAYFNEENVRRYGDYLPPPPKPVNAAAMAQDVSDSVTANVMDYVAQTITSDTFMDSLAERLAAKLKAPEVPV